MKMDDYKFERSVLDRSFGSVGFDTERWGTSH
jgi:hypothetical protein